MRMDQGAYQRMALRQNAAALMADSLEILELPALGLEQMMREAAENPALVLEEEEPERREAPGTGRDDADDPDSTRESLSNEMDGARERLSDPIGLRGPRRQSAGAAQEAADAKWEAMQNAPARDGTLAEYLAKQLCELDLAPHVRVMAEAIASSLDADGLLRTSLEEVAARLKEPMAKEAVEAALAAVQSLDPPGVGGRGLAECLLLQIEPDDPHFEIKRRLLREHASDIERNRIKNISKSLGVSAEQVYGLLGDLRRLNPRPGASWSSEPVRRVRPDAVVEWGAGEWQVQLAGDLPRLRLLEDYEPTAEDVGLRRLMREAAEAKPELRRFATGDKAVARWLIGAIAQRERTLLRVFREVMRHQRAFLEKGLPGLRPLKEQEIADALGLSAPTVSRAVNGKYIQTHRGILPLSFFFPRAATAADGVVSTAWVKSRVEYLIEREDPAHRLSDDRIAEILSEESHVVVARRTVTKYRKGLRIPSSYARRGKFPSRPSEV